MAVPVVRAIIGTNTYRQVGDRMRCYSCDTTVRLLTSMFLLHIFSTVIRKERIPFLEYLKVQIYVDASANNIYNL